MARPKQDASQNAVRLSVTIEPAQLAALQQEAAIAPKRDDRSASAQVRAAIDMYLHRLGKRRARPGDDEGSKSDDNHGGR